MSFCLRFAIHFARVCFIAFVVALCADCGALFAFWFGVLLLIMVGF